MGALRVVSGGGRSATPGLASPAPAQEEEGTPRRCLSYCPRHSLEAEEAQKGRWRRRERKGALPTRKRFGRGSGLAGRKVRGGKQWAPAGQAPSGENPTAHQTGPMEIRRRRRHLG